MNRLKFKSVGVMLLVNNIFYILGLAYFLISVFSKIDIIEDITNIILLFFIALLLLTFIFIQFFGGFSFLEFSKLNDNEIIKNKNRILGWTVATFYANFIIGIFAFIACYSIDDK